jgi:endonuclease/exonuclease/phosphatase family metal-dependent hydrolase
MIQLHRPISKPTLRVMTWNIHKGVGGFDRRYDLSRTIAVIKHYDPDILLLQEVAQGVKRLRFDDQVDLLTNELGYHAAFHPEHAGRVGGYGNLILARWPLHSPLHLDLTIGSRKRRGMLQVHVRTNIDGHQRSVVINNLHLGLAGTERGRQLERFVALPTLKLLTHVPVIIGGDLNDLWGNLGRRYLLPSGFERAGRLANTFPSTFPLRPLDGIYYRGGLKLINFAVGRLRLASSASDHLPIYADFALDP